MESMAKGDWPKAYVIPSLALSVTAAGFLLWHVIDPEAKVDGWTITLIVVGFLPWLRTVFESIDFPGGGSVKYLQKVEAEQERQAEDIQALRFLLARFLAKPERELLQRLASGDVVRIDTNDNRATLQYVDSLRRMGMIAAKAELRGSVGSGHTSMDITAVGEIFDVTDSGRQYLELLAVLPGDISQSYPDASELRTGPSTPPL
ncbi:hypothetical protein AWC24_04325 [Mycolicibacter senuensis]|uniref:Uncharacterized protein n=2 Tax=Mycobacteriaceae TaxID=1762 RepID=A0A7I9XNC8_9MYCO|nr:hypothetical protein A5631_05420 [Mycolicibacter heraklionensis]ORW69960.1 hypothetical protein AWC24_04325 [Mycolicibacter senuensis]GFG71481.1 hypothetical protein MSEN_32010 [Mycolicibacter senuensis]